MKDATQFKEAIDNYDVESLGDIDWTFGEASMAIAERLGLDWLKHITRADHKRIVTFKSLVMEALTYNIVQEEIAKQIEWMLFGEISDEEE